MFRLPAIVGLLLEKIRRRMLAALRRRSLVTTGIIIGMRKGKSRR
jgi:hypothetical protein